MYCILYFIQRKRKRTLDRKLKRICLTDRKNCRNYYIIYTAHYENYFRFVEYEINDKVSKIRKGNEERYIGVKVHNTR